MLKSWLHRVAYGIERPLTRLLDLCRQQEQEDGGEGAGTAAAPIADAGPGSFFAGRGCLSSAAGWWHYNTPQLGCAPQ